MNAVESLTWIDAISLSAFITAPIFITVLIISYIGDNDAK